MSMRYFNGQEKADMQEMKNTPTYFERDLRV